MGRIRTTDLTYQLTWAELAGVRYSLFGFFDESAAIADHTRA